jgi:uncharacterized metal-binding protein YceD (DUF177 family)
MSDLGAVFSRVIRAAQVKQGRHEHVVTASAAECAALAAAFGLPGIAALRGKFTLAHESGGVISAELVLSARVTQICVITLEPFDQEVAEVAALRFIPAARVPESADFSAPVDAETLAGPDEIIYSGETIDLGAALAEQLALALEPYPKRPGAELPAEVLDTGAENPFAVLGVRRGKAEG